MRCLHAGKHQHMRVMTDKGPVKGRAMQVRHEPPVCGDGNVAAMQRRGKVADKHMDMRRHMLEMPGIGRRELFKPARRNQRGFGRW